MCHLTRSTRGGVDADDHQVITSPGVTPQRTVSTVGSRTSGSSKSSTKRNSKNILKDHMIRRLSKDVLELKEPIPVIKHVVLNDEQRKIYNKVRDELVLVDKTTGKEKDIDNALTKFLRLKQICGSTYTFTGTDTSAKLDQALEDAIQIVKGQKDKLIVFTQFRDIQQVYAARLQAEGIPVWQLHGDVKTNQQVGIVKKWSMCRASG